MRASWRIVATATAPAAVPPPPPAAAAAAAAAAEKSTTRAVIASTRYATRRALPPLLPPPLSLPALSAGPCTARLSRYALPWSVRSAAAASSAPYSTTRSSPPA